jgi:hypothetical protein
MYFTHMPIDPVLYVAALKRRTASFADNWHGQTQAFNASRPEIHVANFCSIAAPRRRKKQQVKVLLPISTKVGHSPCRSTKHTAGVQHGRSASQVTKAAGELSSLPTPNGTSASRIVNKTAKLENGINASCSFQARRLRKLDTVHAEVAAS